jgi:hypothetical protein
VSSHDVAVASVVCVYGACKSGGCNHMTCAASAGGCGHEFCWLCLGKFPKCHCNHFEQQSEAAANALVRQDARQRGRRGGGGSGGGGGSRGLWGFW